MKIGITIRMNENTTFQSNGMLQNLYFLADSLNKINGWECYFLHQGVPDPDLVLPRELCIPLDKYLKNNPFKFDALILGGFSGNIFKERVFEDTKLIALHCGARLIDDMFRSLHEIDNDDMALRFFDVDEIWTLPHFSRNVGYLKTLYNNKNVKVMPYVWDSKFIDILLKKNGFQDRNDFITEARRSAHPKNLNIYEPNNTVSKTSLLPLAIAVEHRRHGREKLYKCNVFCTEKIVKSKYFIRLCNSLDVVKDPTYFAFHKRLEILNSLKLYGLSSIIASHQLAHELNNLYFDVFYLGLPLLHNSNILSSHGYFFPESDTIEAARQIDMIIENYNIDFDLIDNENMNLLDSYSPYNSKNISAYEEAIYRLVNGAKDST